MRAARLHECLARGRALNQTPRGFQANGWRAFLRGWQTYVDTLVVPDSVATVVLGEKSPISVDDVRAGRRVRAAAARKAN